jgi:hypothetical protein
MATKTGPSGTFTKAQCLMVTRMGYAAMQVGRPRYLRSVRGLHRAAYSQQHAFLALDQFRRLGDDQPEPFLR